MDEKITMRSLLGDGNDKGTYSGRTIESNLGGGKLTQNAGNLSIQKIRDFEVYVQCLINVGENPFELTDQVTLYMEMLLTTEYPDDELGPSIPNSEAPLPLGHFASHRTPPIASSSFCDLTRLKAGFQNIFSIKKEFGFL
ncbi:hypothetical protein VitviT2T_001128 [Vitis vinifera]|uniref:Uncharacterized protein n=1 Tax=Vitis vinifera TaxID=29760 RepID=A0ABY9BF01_VITVI|nr:hypothetical protein VitviT2T_001128 [Vitis vinifera]